LQYQNMSTSSIELPYSTRVMRTKSWRGFSKKCIASTLLKTHAWAAKTTARYDKSSKELLFDQGLPKFTIDVLGSPLWLSAGRSLNPTVFLLVFAV
jgi:hypothetical protein